MIDCIATRRHFIDHSAPIFAALGPNAGTYYTTTNLVEHAALKGVPEAAIEVVHPPEFKKGSVLRFVQKGYDDRVMMSIPSSTRPTLTASIGGVSIASGWRSRNPTGRPIALLEHGCGMSFSSGIPNHPGGGGIRDAVSLFLMPNFISAERDRAAHPKAETVIVGCPKLDKWFSREPLSHQRKQPVIAFVFHWNADGCPETRSSWGEYEGSIPRAVQKYPGAIGHCHPRSWEEMRNRFASVGLTPIMDFDDVMTVSDLLCGDGGSAPYEFAASGRPVVVRNSKHYRRTVDHGIRFWQHIPGVECDHPEHLMDAIKMAWCDPKPLQRLRESAVKAVYTYTDGSATERAVSALLAWAGRCAA